MTPTRKHCWKLLLMLIVLEIFCIASSATSVHLPDQNGDIQLQNDNGSHDNITTPKNDPGDGADHHEHVGIHVASLRYDYVQQPLIIAVFLFAAGIFKLGFHHAEFLSSAVPESCLLIILGIIVGAIMNEAFDEDYEYPGLTSTLFFLYLLPPIILESAYSLHDRAFFENVGTVIIFAVIGTVLNCFLIGPTLYGLRVAGAMGGNIDLSLIQCLVFSAVIVAVDPVAVLAIFQEIGVNNALYFLVFGESLFNDAVTVVLYNMMKEFNKMSPPVPVDQVFLGIVAFFVVSLGGLTVGILFGVLTAIITKYTEHVRVVEPLTVFVLAYISYLVAELFHFSGIISIIGCGLTQAQYAFHNISAKSHTTIKYFSKMQSATSDCIIFMFLGIALFKSDTFKKENWHPWFILWTLVLCLLYRFIVVFGLTYLMNKSNRTRRIDVEEQFIMAYGGLRGAVAFSLVDLLDEKYGLPRNIFITTTLSVIFFTVFVQGITIKPLVKLLRVKLQEKKVLSITEEINTHVTDHVMAGIEEVLGEHGEHYVREILEYYNRKYIKNWLQRDPMSVDEQIMSMFEEIALQQHFETLAGSKMIQEKYSSNEERVIPSIPEENEEEEEESPSEHGSDDLVLPSVTVKIPTYPTVVTTPSTPPAIDLHDQELEFIKASAQARRKTVGNIRRKSLFPGFAKRRESKAAASLENPTAKDVRKIMVPSRREVGHRKLDKNLRDDSQVDLLRYLQDKQLRTRRMSRAVLGMGTSMQTSPKSSNLSLGSSGAPRKSVDANTAMANYRRRLSLVVPEQRPNFQRDRSPSDITGLHSNIPFRIGDAAISPAQSPKIKKHPFKRGLSLGNEPIEKDNKELSPLNKSKKPSSPTRTTFQVIHENEEEDHSDIGSKEHLQDSKDSKDNVSVKSSESDKSARKRRRLKKVRTVDDGRVRRSNTDPISRPHVTFDTEKRHHSAKRHPLMKSDSVRSDEVEDVPPTVPSDDPVSRQGSIRKDSYAEAMSDKLKITKL